MRKQMIFEKLAIATLALWPAVGTLLNFVINLVLIWVLISIPILRDQLLFPAFGIVAATIMLLFVSALEKVTKYLEKEMQEDLYSFEFSFYALAYNVPYAKGTNVALWAASGAAFNGMLLVMFVLLQAPNPLVVFLLFTAIPYGMYLLLIRKYLRGLRHIQYIQWYPTEYRQRVRKIMGNG